jgi:hypothetical protein
MTSEGTTTFGKLAFAERRRISATINDCVNLLTDTFQDLFEDPSDLPRDSQKKILEMLSSQLVPVVLQQCGWKPLDKEVPPFVRIKQNEEIIAPSAAIQKMKNDNSSFKIVNEGSNFGSDDGLKKIQIPSNQDSLPSPYPMTNSRNQELCPLNDESKYDFFALLPSYKDKVVGLNQHPLPCTPSSDDEDFERSPSLSIIHVPKFEDSVINSYPVCDRWKHCTNDQLGSLGPDLSNIGYKSRRKALKWASNIASDRGLNNNFDDLKTSICFYIASDVISDNKKFTFPLYANALNGTNFFSSLGPSLSTTHPSKMKTQKNRKNDDKYHRSSKSSTLRYQGLAKTKSVRSSTLQ